MRQHGSVAFSCTQKERRSYERDSDPGDRLGKTGVSAAWGECTRGVRAAPTGTPQSVAAGDQPATPVHGGNGSLWRGARMGSAYPGGGSPDQGDFAAICEAL